MSGNEARLHVLEEEYMLSVGFGICPENNSFGVNEQ